MPHNNQSNSNEHSLEGRIQMVGMVFLPEVSMSTNSDNKGQRTVRKQPMDNSTSFLGAYGDSVLRNLQASISSILKAQKMAIKVGWWFVFNCMGWSSLVINIILVFIGSIDEVKQWVLLLFTCLFAGIKIWQGYQTGALRREEVRRLKLENDEREYKLKVAHDKYLLQTKVKLQ